MNYKTHQKLSQAVAEFCEEYQDHPLLSDTVAQLKAAMYELDTMLMSPGQLQARSYKPTGQEDNNNEPVHQ